MGDECLLSPFKQRTLSPRLYHYHMKPASLLGCRQLMVILSLAATKMFAQALDCVYTDLCLKRICSPKMGRCPFSRSANNGVVVVAFLRWTNKLTRPNKFIYRNSKRLRALTHRLTLTLAHHPLYQYQCNGLCLLTRRLMLAVDGGADTVWYAM